MRNVPPAAPTRTSPEVSAAAEAAASDRSTTTLTRYVAPFNLAFNTRLGCFPWFALPGNEGRFMHFGHAIMGTRQWETKNQTLQVGFFMGGSRAASSLGPRCPEEAEIDRCVWKAAAELGFWCLKHHGLGHEVDATFDIGAETFTLHPENLMPYHYQQEASLFGYKSVVATVIDKKGTKDTTETMDISQDDVHAYPMKVHQDYPPTISYQRGHGLDRAAVCQEVYGSQLLPHPQRRHGRQAGLSRPEEHSGSTLRLIRAPPATALSGQTFVSSQTDFGSLTILHNRLGGLQVLVPGGQNWQYVKPLDGHTVCNIGDALNVFSAGIMRSNIHRVV